MAKNDTPHQRFNFVWVSHSGLGSSKNNEARVSCTCSIFVSQRNTFSIEIMTHHDAKTLRVISTSGTGISGKLRRLKNPKTALLSLSAAVASMGKSDPPPFRPSGPWGLVKNNVSAVVLENGTRQDKTSGNGQKSVESKRCDLRRTLALKAVQVCQTYAKNRVYI